MSLVIREERRGSQGKGARDQSIEVCFSWDIVLVLVIKIF